MAANKETINGWFNGISNLFKKIGYRQNIWYKQDIWNYVKGSCMLCQLTKSSWFHVSHLLQEHPVLNNYAFLSSQLDNRWWREAALCCQPIFAIKVCWAHPIVYNRKTRINHQQKPHHNMLMGYILTTITYSNWQRLSVAVNLIKSGANAGRL